jgi:eukaryotic-like serine/threonine-protein kinase
MSDPTLPLSKPPAGSPPLEASPTAAGQPATTDTSGLPDNKPAGGPCVPGYALLNELRRGGMGVVYRAYQPSLRRTVAIKMLLTGPLAGADERQRFRTEAEAAGSLQHANIVRVFEVGEVDGLPYFTMDFVNGASLAQRLATGPLPPSEAARLLLDVAAAIDYAHQRGILHRDLKPHNILVAADGRPLVTDFGLAKRLDEAGPTRTGSILGTPSYMAPEQVQGRKDLTVATDVYGLGAVLYECLTGRPPFRAPTPLDTLTQVLDCEPAPPRLLNPQVPRDLETICLKCLEKTPQRRYARAADLAGDLDRFLRGDTIVARSQNLVQRLARTLERRQQDEHFAAYGSLFYWLALVMLVPEILIALTAWHDWPNYVLPIWQTLRVVAFVGLVWYYRRGRLLPVGIAERQLFSIWGGYLATCYVVGISNRIWQGWQAVVELRLYPTLSCLTAVAFFAMGSNYWGWSYVFGACFMMLPFLMGLEPSWAPVEFGMTWAAILLLIGHHLRQLDAKQS